MIESSALRALILSFMAGMSTLLGALIIFVTNKKSEKLVTISLGFAGGVMISVSFTVICFPMQMLFLHNMEDIDLG